MNANKPVLRMCVACRAMKDKRELIRVVMNKEGRIFADIGGKAAGRGAFVCASPECLAKCRKQKSFNRAFKCDVPLAVYDEIALAVDNAVKKTENVIERG